WRRWPSAMLATPASWLRASWPRRTGTSSSGWWRCRSSWPSPPTPRVRPCARPLAAGAGSGSRALTIRWGIAGTGGMARAFVDDFQHVPSARLAAVGSRVPDRAGELAGPHGAVATTHRELVAADIDVLYVATPHAQHRDLALAAIANGTPVLVEKAFTATLTGAREV